MRVLVPEFLCHIKKRQKLHCTKSHTWYIHYKKLRSKGELYTTENFFYSLYITMALHYAMMISERYFLVFQSKIKIYYLLYSSIFSTFVSTQFSYCVQNSFVFKKANLISLTWDDNFNKLPKWYRKVNCRGYGLVYAHVINPSLRFLEPEYHFQLHKQRYKKRNTTPLWNSGNGILFEALYHSLL